MKLRKLNLKKAALLSATGAAVILSCLGQKNIQAETKKNEPKKETITNYDEELLFDDLLTTVDGYCELHDYDNILRSKKSTTKEESKPIVTPTPEVSEEETVVTPAIEEIQKETNNDPQRKK